MLINNLGPAGAESQVLHLAAGLAEAGHEVTVACQRGVIVPLDALHRAGVRVVAFGAASPRQKLRMLPRLVKLARQADVVHCSMWDASMWGRLAAMIARRPVVVAEHSVDRGHVKSQTTGKPRGSWIALHNRLLDPFTYATVACAASQFPVLTGEGVSQERIVLIPNGVPVDEIRERSQGGVTREELAIPAEATLLVHVARFQPFKNQVATLEVVRRMREDRGDVRVLFAGWGSLLEEVKQRAADMGADEWAYFLGRREDVPALLSIADLSVLPSLTEAMPMTIVESLAVGVPVVATDVGDVRSVLERTGGGVVVPPGDDDAYEQACRRMLDDRELHERTALQGPVGARELFDSARMVDRYSALLGAAADRAPVPAIG